jgi:alkanesulfonate monooxygenase SsuD/methylene tetrahydromethanopterin reductase-like flavin-dependent oxidoreductase (luciferase family)
VRYGICLSNLGTYADPRLAVRVAQAADESGWDAVFIWDHLAFVWGPPSVDPYTSLAAIASSTERVLLGTAVTPVARRRLQVLANQVATLDVLSGGRVVFGAGLGGSPSEFRKFGEPTDARLRAAMLDEGLDVLRRLWSGERVIHRGKHYTVDDVHLAPTPQQTRLPIWIGGNRPASLRRASRWDGWIADSSDPTGMTLTPDDVRRSIETIGRGDGFDVAVLGEREGANPSDYERAGASWWLENLHDERGTLDDVLGIVLAGPRP